MRKMATAVVLTVFMATATNVAAERKKLTPEAAVQRLLTLAKNLREDGLSEYADVVRKAAGEILRRSDAVSVCRTDSECERAMGGLIER